jgi:cyclic pyranopterin phosphate synthase
MYAGEGEPLLHKDIAEIVLHTRAVGIDVAITTNGVFLTPALAREILGAVTWVKISINGATPETYSKIHRCNPADLQKVLGNVEEAVKLKTAAGLSCTIGTQLVLLPENRHEVALLAEKVKAAGADYLVVKPYSQHPMSKTRTYEDFSYEEHLHLGDELQKFNDESFQVVFRTHAMRKWDSPDRAYDRCQALPFWTYIDAGGGVWSCSAYLGDERFLCGHITEQTFREIWEGDRRRRCLRWVENELDTSQCRVNCRMDEINRYLWELKHPREHVNFI